MRSRPEAPTSPAIAAVLALAMAACSNATPPGGPDAPPSGPDAPPGDPAPHFDDGALRIDVQSQPFAGGPSTLVWGMLSATPPPWPYDPPVVSGNCRMALRHAIDGCEPACDPTSLCDAGTCRPLPAPQSAGPLAIAGGGASRTIPFDIGYRFFVGEALFAPGDDITVRAPGDELPGFDLTARLPAPIEVLDVDALQLRAGVPLTIRWRPAGDGDRVRVILGADFGHAQWRTVLVECDLPDDAGAVTIPQPMIDELAHRSHWQCGACLAQEVRRYQRASVAYPGADGATLDLWTFHAVYLALTPPITVP